jgi:hypothetical protein
MENEVGRIKGDAVVEIGGKLFIVLWKDKMPPEPVYHQIIIADDEGR